MAGITYEILQKEITVILKNADLTTMSPRDVCIMLGERWSCDLSSRKQEIHGILRQCLRDKEINKDTSFILKKAQEPVKWGMTNFNNAPDDAPTNHEIVLSTNGTNRLNVNSLDRLQMLINLIKQQDQILRTDISKSVEILNTKLDNMVESLNINKFGNQNEVVRNPEGHVNKKGSDFVQLLENLSDENKITYECQESMKINYGVVGLETELHILHRHGGGKFIKNNFKNNMGNPHRFKNKSRIYGVDKRVLNHFRLLEYQSCTQRIFTDQYCYENLNVKIENRVKLSTKFRRKNMKLIRFIQTRWKVNRLQQNGEFPFKIAQKQKFISDNNGTCPRGIHNINDSTPSVYRNGRGQPEWCFYTNWHSGKVRKKRKLTSKSLFRPSYQ